MLLQEITKISYHKLNSTGDDFRRNMGVRDLDQKYAGPDGSPNPTPKSKLIVTRGHGQYATAVQKVGSKQVMKISRGTNDYKQDPYFQYIERLATGDHVENNPYFPNVYDLKVYETTHQKYKYFYIAFMEELHHLTELTQDELKQMIVKYLYPKLSSRIKQTFGQYNPAVKLQGKSVKQLIKILIDGLRELRSRNRQLDDALRFIQNFQKEMDITPRNIMFRKTEDGPQLVLADPLRD